MILGDEMGLGKTIQIIALLAALLNKTSASSADAWMDEFYRRRAPALPLPSPSSSSSSSSPPASSRKRGPSAFPTLLLLPGGLLGQWASEFAAWSEVRASVTFRDRTLLTTLP